MQTHLWEGHSKIIMRLVAVRGLIYWYAFIQRFEQLLIDRYFFGVLNVRGLSRVRDGNCRGSFRRFRRGVSNSGSAVSFH